MQLALEISEVVSVLPLLTAILYATVVSMVDNAPYNETRAAIAAPIPTKSPPTGGPAVFPRMEIRTYQHAPTGSTLPAISVARNAQL